MTKKKEQIKFDLAKLQKREEARPFCLLSISEQQILKQAGIKNCLVLKGGNWEKPTTKNFNQDSTYILESTYSPKYHWESVEVREDNEGQKYLGNSSGVPISIIVQDVDFRGFWFFDKRISIDEVSENMSIAQEVLIRKIIKKSD